MVVKILLLTLLWFAIIAGLAYGAFYYKRYQDEIKTQRLKARYERDMKALEIADKEYEDREF